MHDLGVRDRARGRRGAGGGADLDEVRERVGGEFREARGPAGVERGRAVGAAVRGEVLAGRSAEQGTLEVDRLGGGGLWAEDGG